ncbi:hypothetical protein M8J77_021451 [Diaphorina citri]|nr:hypothetical protein M8J77_021451 [Diaphorina citri]
MADRGFKNIDQDLSEREASLVRPPSTSAQLGSMSKADARLTKQVAALRIHIERVIGRLRHFNFLAPHRDLDNPKENGDSNPGNPPPFFTTTLQQLPTATKIISETPIPDSLQIHDFPAHLSLVNPGNRPYTGPIVEEVYNLNTDINDSYIQSSQFDPDFVEIDAPDNEYCLDENPSVRQQGEDFQSLAETIHSNRQT